MSKLQEIADVVINGKAKLIGGLVQEALDEGNDPSAILNSMIDAMGVVGERFKNNEIFVPEMLVAARAMKKGVEVLKPHLSSGATGALGKVIIGTVAGVLIIAVLNNGLNILGVTSYYQDVIKAVVILVAVLSDSKR